MKLWNRPQPDAPLPGGEAPDRLREIAAGKKAAAERLSAAIAEAGEALEALFEADRAFLQEWHDRHGDWGHGASRLMHQLRSMLLLDLELSAPRLLAYLNQPRQSRARAETIASFIARQVENDLSAQPLPKETVQ